ncbi:MAG TPA: hypothetical protein VJM08_06155 [Anaerolineales bacterium]|nr:hypothetical protein [Anaerolineales bacterium]
MDKALAMALILDLETSLKMIAYALEEKNTILAQEALANAELEVATLRRLLEEPSSRGHQVFRS